MEAAELGTFMISAGVFAALIEHPASPVRLSIDDPLVRRMLMGVLMGLTAITIVHSSWGKQSGAHFNPSVTLTFFRLGKIDPWDAAFYVIAQFVGAVAGILLVAATLGALLADRHVNYVQTLPGTAGPLVAFAAEVAISFVLMLTILTVSNTRTLSRYTGLFAGGLVALYITLEAPLSGMSMNPARSFGPALVAGFLKPLWVYFSAPPLGMLLGAEAYLRLKGAPAVFCAKLHHHNDRRCIFRCAFPMERPSIPATAR